MIREALIPKDMNVGFVQKTFWLHSQSLTLPFLPNGLYNTYTFVTL